MERTKVFGAVGMLVGLAFVLLAVSAFDAAQQKAEADQSVSYVDSHTYVFELGEVAYLDSGEDAQGGAYGWTAGLPWNGCLAVSLEDVAVYREGEAGGDFGGLLASEAMSYIADEADPVDLVVASLKVENISASPVADDDPSFNASVFMLAESFSADIPYAEFGEAALDNATDHDGLKFYLEPNDSEMIKIGWFVYESALSDDMSIVVGASGAEKYSFKVSGDAVREG